MDINLYIDRIEQYETGAMTAAERSAFEAELAGNTDLRQARALYLQANEVLEQGIENKLRHQLENWAGETVQSPAKVVSMQSTWMRMAIAASVTLLIGWFGWQWAGSQYSDQALYAGFYEKPNDTVFRAGAAGESHPLQPGYDAMKAHDWKTAVAFFSTITHDSDYYSEALYYLGHANLGLKNYDAAIAAFKLCLDQNGSKFKEKTEWNLLLAYTAAGKTGSTEFKLLLDETANNSAHSFQLKAKELKQDLGSFWR
jgi:tetratricopeptide (TPR) repeat protein